VQGKVGTARADGHIPGLPYAAKTGTAQSGRGEPHAWYAGFVPSPNPRFAFVVAIERGGSGSHAAAPVAVKLLKFMRDQGMLRPPQER